MGILNDLLARVQSVSDGLESGTLIRDVVVRYGNDILELQKMQLLRGLASSGEDIRPYYSEDLKPGGYFHSVESAGRYAAWKKGLSYPYSVSGRNDDAPNLYITGKFHDELDVEFGADAVGVIGTTPYAKGIMFKYGMNTFGLMAAYWAVIWQERGALDDLNNELRRILYGN